MAFVIHPIVVIIFAIELLYLCVVVTIEYRERKKWLDELEKKK